MRSRLGRLAGDGVSRARLDAGLDGGAWPGRFGAGPKILLLFFLSLARDRTGCLKLDLLFLGFVGFFRCFPARASLSRRALFGGQRRTGRRAAAATFISRRRLLFFVSLAICDVCGIRRDNFHLANTVIVLVPQRHSAVRLGEARIRQTRPRPEDRGRFRTDRAPNLGHGPSSGAGTGGGGGSGVGGSRRVTVLGWCGFLSLGRAATVLVPVLLVSAALCVRFRRLGFSIGVAMIAENVPQLGRHSGGGRGRFVRQSYVAPGICEAPVVVATLQRTDASVSGRCTGSGSWSSQANGDHACLFELFVVDVEDVSRCTHRRWLWAIVFLRLFACRLAALLPTNDVYFFVCLNKSPLVVATAVQDFFVHQTTS